ncbi:MAG: nuclear transport factor 2 family protein [Phycisphaerae bacterium]|nr:nuclear transport factor 2 family protein [Phycisphaerae bacterium]
MIRVSHASRLWAATMLAALAGCVSGGSHAPPSPRLAGAALDDFHDAAANADFDRYMRRWTDRSVFLGTDATERWTGQEFRDFARPHFDQSKGGKGWTYHPRARRITAIDQDHAYFDELLDHAKLGECRGSGVLGWEDGRWKVLQYNLSIPIPNALAEDFAGRIKQHASEQPGR